MTLPRNPGRVAGLWYLLLVIVGPLRLIYVPTKLFVDGDASATASHIAAHETLFRVAIAGDLIGAVVLVLMALAFYRLFESVDKRLAVQVVIFGGVMPSLLYFVNVTTDLCTLLLVRGAHFLNVFDQPQRDALAYLFIRMHDYQNTAAEILWGVWLVPLALLVYRSRFVPRWLGVWLMINGIAYVIISLTGVLLPQYADQMFTYSKPARLGEIALVLWLLIRGATPPALARGEAGVSEFRAS